MTPEEMVARLLYRDGLMLVIDKPAGFAVHRGPNGGGKPRRPFRRAALRACRARRRWRTGSTATPRAAWCSAAIARPCRSLASCSRTARSTRPIGPSSKARPDANEGVIELPLGRLDDKRGWWMKHDPEGQPAVTKWQVLGRSQALTWLALEPVTGRTHQLRVHCADMGWPILGDAIYGTAPRTAARPASCAPARSWCRSTRTARRSALPRRCRRICASGLRRADGKAKRN